MMYLKNDKYICQTCGLILHINGVGKGSYYAFNDEILICPVCVSKDKQPTARLGIEELEKRKAKIKERLK